MAFNITELTGGFRGLYLDKCDECEYFDIEKYIESVKKKTHSNIFIMAMQQVVNVATLHDAAMPSSPSPSEAPSARPQ